MPHMLMCTGGSGRVVQIIGVFCTSAAIIGMEVL